MDLRAYFEKAKSPQSAERAARKENAPPDQKKAPSPTRPQGEDSPASALFATPDMNRSPEEALFSPPKAGNFPTTSQLAMAAPIHPLRRSLKRDGSPIAEPCAKIPKTSGGGALTPPPAMEAVAEKEEKASTIFVTAEEVPSPAKGVTEEDTTVRSEGVGKSPALTEEDPAMNSDCESVSDDFSTPALGSDDCNEKRKEYNSFIDQMRGAVSSKPSKLQRLVQGANAGSLFGLTKVTVEKKKNPDKDLNSVFFSPDAFTRAEIFERKKKADDKPKPKAFFKPVKTAAASAVESLPFSVLSNGWDLIGDLVGAGGNSSKKQTVILTNLFRLILYHSPADFIPSLLLCQNKVAPDYEGVELGVGDGLLVSCIKETYGRSDKALRAQIREYEDLGRVAEISRSSMVTLTEPKPLTIMSVFTQMKALPALQGSNSVNRKKDSLKKMLLSAQGSEPKYIIRFCQAKMRIGMQVATIYAGLACAFSLSPRITPHEALSDGELPARLDALWNPSPATPEMYFVADSRYLEPKDAHYSSVDDLETEIQHLNLAIRSAHTRLPNMPRLGTILALGATHKNLPLLITVTPGVPLQPMLAKPTKGVDEIFIRLKDVKFTCEYKYDGERAQIHYTRKPIPGFGEQNAKSGASIRVFSRNLENMSSKYPDLVQLIDSELAKPENAGVESAIIDSEVVAYDTVKERILPFQILTQRKRKDVEEKDIEIKVCLFLFDCIYFNGSSLIDETFLKRRTILHKNIHEVKNQLQFAIHRDCETIDEVDEFLNDAIQASCEGLMIKTTVENATYQPSKRSLNWLKLKKDYLDDVGDSLDLVVMGAFWGTGKRSAVYGAFLLGVYDPETGCFQTVCKAGTGFSDEDLQRSFASLSELKVEKKPNEYQISSRMMPDVCFSPKTVWEIRCGDINISPVHLGAVGLVVEDKGIGLRFPRFVRERDDKSPEMATSNEQLADMYQNQAVIVNNRD